MYNFILLDGLKSISFNYFIKQDFLKKIIKKKSKVFSLPWITASKYKTPRKLAMMVSSRNNEMKPMKSNIPDPVILFRLSLLLT